MQQTASWRIWVIGGALVTSTFLSTAWSQQSPAPAPPQGADAKTYVEYGQSLGARHDYDGAIKAFNQAISIDPKYAPAYYYRGFAYSLENNHEAAISNYDQTVSLDPTYKSAFYQRGSLKGEQGDFDAALRDFTAVINLDPKYAPAYYNRGHVEYFKGDLDGAAGQINQALSLDPNYPYSYFIRGLIRHAHSDRGARDDFEKSAGFNFSSATYWVWITDMEAGQPAVARKDLTQYLDNPEIFRPDDWPSQIGNFLLGKITRDQLMSKASTDNPSETTNRTCEAWFYIGMYEALSLGAPDKARECFKKAVATGMTGSEEYIEAGRALAKMQPL